MKAPFPHMPDPTTSQVKPHYSPTLGGKSQVFVTLPEDSKESLGEKLVQRAGVTPKKMSL